MAFSGQAILPPHRRMVSRAGASTEGSIIGGFGSLALLGGGVAAGRFLILIGGAALVCIGISYGWGDKDSMRCLMAVFIWAPCSQGGGSTLTRSNAMRS
jgi:hypothetical protein